MLKLIFSQHFEYEYDDVKMSLKVALLLAVQGVEDPNGQNWNDDGNFMQCNFWMGPSGNPLGLV